MYYEKSYFVLILWMGLNEWKRAWGKISYHWFALVGLYTSEWFFLDLGNKFSDKSFYENELLEVQGQLNSLEVTFLLGEVFDLEHQSLLEDIAYEILTSTHGSELSVSERAKLIITAWLKALLALKGGFLKLDWFLNHLFLCRLLILPTVYWNF